jgi:glycosyltransferase involved in cell wall biosynthesis
MTFEVKPHSQPYFSIGVTTYRRPKFLRQCIDSLLAQTYDDFEVLIGNDDPLERVSLESIGLSDQRIRIINRERNLGEIDNMNALLSESRGAYFTWLCDDDLHAPSFLEAISFVHKVHGIKECVFASYSMEEDGVNSGAGFEQHIKLYSGNKFLIGYLKRDVKTQGCYGVFNRQYLLSQGGMKKLGSGTWPYSDCRLAVMAGALPKVAYIDLPLILFRAHADSLSYTCTDVDHISTAQEDYIDECIPVFQVSTCQSAYRTNLYHLLRWFVGDYMTVMRRSGRIQWGKMMRYLRFICVRSRDLDVLRRMKIFMETIARGVRAMAALQLGRLGRSI